MQQAMRNDNSMSPPSTSMFKSEAAVDIGYSLLGEKKERTMMTLSSPIIPSISNKTVVPYHSDSDEDQAAFKSNAAASSFNENDLVDFDKLTCLLCKRAFPSGDVLNKHVKISNLHKENMQKYKLQNGLLNIEASGSSQSALR